jgi:spore maturation protein CgeB
MKIDFLIGENPYGTTPHFARGLAKALENMGVETRLFDVSDGCFFQAYYSILENPPDYTCSFSDINFEKKSLGEFLQIPHFSFLVDPPIYYLHQLQGNYSYVSCVDRLDCAFVKSLDFKKVSFLPHAADEIHRTHVEVERPLDAVFFGTCIDYETIFEIWPDSIKDLLLEASHQVLSPKGISIAQALLNLGVSSYDLPRYHAEVDHFTRGKDRIEMLRVLEGNINIWGNGPWEKYVPHATVHPSIPFDQTLAVMKKSKVVLNSSPRFKSGAHERIFYAFMCGAAAYSGDNDFIREEVPETITYFHGAWKKGFFGNWKERAQQGQERIIEYHTWKSRAQSLLHLMA